MKSILLVSCLALVASSVVACGSSTSNNTTSPTGSGATVSAIAVSPDPCAVGRTDSIKMQALATFADGTKQDITTNSNTAWATGDANTATVDSSGTLVGVSAGITAVSATYEGVTGKVDCAVGP